MGRRNADENSIFLNSYYELVIATTSRNINGRVSGRVFESVRRGR
jgi:hypothetical protein